MQDGVSREKSKLSPPTRGGETTVPVQAAELYASVVCTKE